jgi:hypothetical protein
MIQSEKHSSQEADDHESDKNQMEDDSLTAHG